MRALLTLSAAGLIAVLVMTAAAVNTGSAADEPLADDSGAVFAGQVTDSPTPTTAATTAAATTAAATTAAATVTATPAAIPDTGGSPDSGGTGIATYLLLAIGAVALGAGGFAVARAGRAS